MSDENQLLGVAKLGVEAEAFMRSPLGVEMLKQADMEIAEATAKLVDADPDDRKSNRDLRNTIKVAGMFGQWLRDTAVIGQHAVDQLREIENQGE